MNKEIHWHAYRIKKEDRARIKKHRGGIIWLTGLPSSGKSTIANALDYSLTQRGIHTYVLDGDNVRHRLNKDLGFSPEDREENIRRIGEVAKLFVDAGIIIITAFISPYKNDRDLARRLVEKGEFIEVYVRCSLKVCEERDVKGLYGKARKGILQQFTGVSAPYEEPENPEIIVESDKTKIEECVQKIIKYSEDEKILLKGDK